MPSVSGNTCSEDSPALCPHAANLMRTDVAQDIKSSTMGGVGENATSGNGSSANGEADHVSVCDESHKESGKNGESELKNGEGIKWIRPDLPSRCTWRLGAPISESPHNHPER